MDFELHLKKKVSTTTKGKKREIFKQKNNNKKVSLDQKKVYTFQASIYLLLLL